MGINEDVKTYAENALAEAKKASEEGRKPFYAVVGLNDLVLEQTKAVAEKAQAALDSYREQVAENVTKLREQLEETYAEGRKKAAELPKSLQDANAHSMQAGIQEYLNAIVKTYESLSDRGEALLDELTRTVNQNPLVKRVNDLGDKAADDAVALVNRGQDVARKAQSRAKRTLTDAERAARNTAKDAKDLAEDSAEAVKDTVQDAAKSTPAKKTPARKTAAQKTAAQKTATKRTPAKKAPAKKTTSKDS